MTEWVGRSLGRYDLESVIGQGAMGVVLRARDPELERPVAVKILYPHLAADRELVERFRREARTAANLHHRNIVAIYDVGQEGKLYYLVMEYLDGAPLSKIVREQGALPPEKVCAIAEQIASALDYIAERKLVHRDVKAGNIIVNGDGRAVLTDFGLARALSGSALTASGAILGTPHYIAPEQLAGGEVGLPTDLYALGVVIYETLSGHFPFDADPPSALFFQVLWEQPTPIASQGLTLPPAVDDVLARALAKEPQARYPSGAAFVTALRQALTGAAMPAVEVASPAPAKQRRRPFILRWQVALVIALVLLMGGGAGLLLGPDLLKPATPTAEVPAGLTGITRPTPSTTPLPTSVPTKRSPSLPVLVVPTPQPTTLAPGTTKPATPARTAGAGSPTLVPPTATPTAALVSTPVPATTTPVPTTRKEINPTVPPPTERPPTNPPPTEPPPTEPPPNTEPPPGLVHP